MPQRFLSIKNFEKYQTYKLTNPPWFKIHKIMFGDPEFIKLTPAYRFLYIGLIYLAVESNNKIYNDSTFLIQRLYLSPTDLRHLAYTAKTDGIQKPYKTHTQLDLRPLYRGGFIKCSNLHRCLSDQIRSDQNSTEAEADGASAPPHPLTTVEPRRKKPLTELPDGFTFNERHKSIADGLGLNVHAECARFKDKALAKGWTYKDWDAAFRNWLSTTADFKHARRA